MASSTTINTLESQPIGSRRIIVSNRRPIATFVCIAAVGFACSVLARAHPRERAHTPDILVSGGLAQRDAIRQSGDIVMDVLPSISRARLTAEGVTLESGRGASWDVTCTDMHGDDRATVVWDAVSGQLISFGTVQDHQPGHHITGMKEAGRLSDRWLHRLAAYGWPRHWDLQKVVPLGGKAWRADYSARLAFAYVLLDANSARLMQAHFTALKPTPTRVDPRLCSASQPHAKHELTKPSL